MLEQLRADYDEWALNTCKLTVLCYITASLDKFIEQLNAMQIAKPMQQNHS